MELTEIAFEGQPPVDGYGAGFFRIAGEQVQGAVLLSPEGVTSWEGYSTPEALIALKDAVDVVFVGTGAETAFMPEAFQSACEAEGLHVEAMASPAAARTYNVLLSEGRRVALAALPV